ncbi:hypothetical protein PIB30_066234 [Stylosanthes scabra]|uniref:Uncharacterized protein n=1 Tax=Stylosanthes scabra TaxID=79078 RepID=A0ABU6TM00_9FABA|nr:hypothetical protein [Stylosanthes scabra]
MKANLKKSKAVCSKNVSSRRRDLLRGVFNICFANDLGKYLGVNLNHTWPSRVVCMESVEKIRKRLAGWKGRLLNKVDILAWLVGKRWLLPRDLVVWVFVILGA